MNPKCIQDWYDAQERRRQVVNSRVEAAFHAEEACERTGMGEVEFSDITLRVYIRLTGANSFDEALPLIPELAKLGYHTRKSEPFRDYHEYLLRSYNLGPIELDVHLKPDGASCRRVQVGVKEEPVYEFVCD